TAAITGCIGTSSTTPRRVGTTRYEASAPRDISACSKTEEADRLAVMKTSTRARRFAPAAAKKPASRPIPAARPRGGERRIVEGRVTEVLADGRARLVT